MTKSEALYVHIPKTGGTSLFRLLQQREGVSVYNPKVQSYCRLPWFEAKAQEHPDTDIWFGHFHYEPELRRRFNWVGTILRDPLSRIWSLYQHARREQIFDLGEAPEQSFEEFIEGRSRHLADGMTRQLSASTKKHIGPAEYAQARANLLGMDFARAVDNWSLRDGITAADTSLSNAIGPCSPTQAPGLRRIPHERKGVVCAASAAGVRTVCARNPYDLALWREWMERNK